MVRVTQNVGMKLVIMMEKIVSIKMNVLQGVNLVNLVMEYVKKIVIQLNVGEIQ